MSIPQHPTSYQLGQHTLEWSEGERFTIVSDTTAIELEPEEAYRLHLVLQELFRRQDHPISKDVSYAPR